ncbi:hypothetical protein J6S35_02705 [Candidatus Saccharibacteria bacterium]|nr:hypothetical protein [Candidatus Saccharibacteria bacterium]
MKEDNTKKEVIKKKRVEFPIGSLILTIASFLLAIFDMIMLQGPVNHLTHLGNGMSMIFSFVLATVANFTALLWGKENGENLSEHSINKHSRGFFITWVIIGLVYAMIRLLDLFFTPGAMDNLLGNIIQIIPLTVSYVGTGTLISASAKRMFDSETAEARRAKKEFDYYHEKLSVEVAEIERAINMLQNYDRHYDSLKLQRNKTYLSISKTERSAMSDIVGRVISSNDIEPSLAYSVMEDVLKKREENDNEIQKNIPS